jgi:7-cyano-7-deazaguanine reductase
MTAPLRPALKPLGRRIQQSRQNAKLTQMAVGRNLGVSKQQVSHWETGRSDITREHLLALARLFGVDMDWLARGTMMEPQGSTQATAGLDPTAAGLAQLGQKVALPSAPGQAVLERVANPHTDTAYVARFTAPEFTTLCPVTGQPDFAHLVIDYVPDAWLVESKSLKLYLGAFRNHGAFHEDCTVTIGKRLGALLEPHYLRIGGYWYPRGGMPIDVFWQTGALPEGVWLPDQGVAPYRGRG